MCCHVLCFFFLTGRLLSSLVQVACYSLFGFLLLLLNPLEASDVFEQMFVRVNDAVREGFR